jgi:hypothetical protein
LISKERTVIKTVTAAGLSSNGKPYVSFDGDKTRYYVSQKIESPVLGAVIDAETSSKRFDGAKFDTWFLNSWKVPPVKTAEQVKNEIATAAVERVAADPKKAFLASPVVNPGSWMIDYGDCSRFVSNVLGSAIQAGLVKDPSDIHPWIVEAYTALQGLRTGKPVAFNDSFKLPPEMPGPGRDEEEFEEEVPF